MQIEMLQPIAELAKKIKNAEERLAQLMTDKDTAVYWFAKQLIDLAKEKLDVAVKEKEKLEAETRQLRQREEKLKQEERTLALAIEKDEVGRKLKELNDDIERLTKERWISITDLPKRQVSPRILTKKPLIINVCKPNNG